MAGAYSQAQLSRYLEFVGCPIPVAPNLTSTYLETLHIHQISSIPYENLSLHYSPTKSNSLDPQILFNKIVSPHHRGGYCFELAIFFKHILLGCGFDVYTAAATIRLRQGVVPHGPYAGYMHVVNIVTLEEEKFVVDVSFGGDGITRPMPLVHDQPQRNLGGQDVRFVKQSIESGGEEFWIYQYRINDGDWNSYYAFQEKESGEEEMEMRNKYVSLDSGSFQRKTVLVVKFLREESRIVGKLMLADEAVRRNTGGKTETVEVCSTEMQRVEALKKWFDLSLSWEQIDGIRGHPTEIKPSAV